MISLKQQYEDSSTQMNANEYQLPFSFSNQTPKLLKVKKLMALSKKPQKKTHQQRKSIIYGDKDRSSTLYKYIKEKQISYLELNQKATKSTMTPEEDRILLLLVKKLGPKFQKINKYFPGKTMNMLKNRYYKSLKNSEASIIPKEIEEELVVKDKQKRIMGKKIIKILPEEQRISTIIDNSELFPEAKERMQLFLQGFTQIIANLMKNN